MFQPLRRRFQDRRAAGKELAQRLRELPLESADAVVLALPRGGVPVGYEVALALGVRLDVFTVRKLGVPGHEELAMGAIASGGFTVFDRRIVERLRITPECVEAAIARERVELERREQLYRDDRSFPSVRSKTVVLVDDGLATGSSMLAALTALREQGPKRIVVAVPVAPPETCAAIERHADAVVTVETPSLLDGVGSWYDDFSQVGDDEVRRLLGAARAQRG
ncbi:MAG: phosphoribosyltransferase [Vulcanimicrobiaceae bacterium]|jgi:predicted phosphoribosyltransferase